MKNKTTLLYTIGGLLIGVLLTTCYFSFNSAAKKPQMMSRTASPLNTMTHQMPEGSMMAKNSQTDMDSMIQGMMAGLNGKTGDDFDKAFLTEMITHHQGAVVMAQSVIKNSKRPELIKLANNIISAQMGEIVMMKNWQKMWFTVQK